ncbi:hypothetical protein [Kurthia senegalensis]|uniref:hypothetical protein n=1 Tax=Kurthia senegalensis TaxID=1033740 RepID=UPI000287B218|nr:hypothetical protein [Kurthia senegalensis]
MKRIIRKATLQDAEQLAAIQAICQSIQPTTPSNLELDEALWKIYLTNPNYAVYVIEDRIVVGFIASHFIETTKTIAISEPFILNRYEKTFDRDMLHDAITSTVYNITD